jgi:hypothetical protein
LIAILMPGCFVLTLSTFFFTVFIQTLIYGSFFHSCMELNDVGFIDDFSWLSSLSSTSSVVLSLTNNLFSETVDRIKRKAMSEMNKRMNENDTSDEKSQPMSRSKRIRPAQDQEVKEEKNIGRDKIEFSMKLRRRQKK